MTTTTTLGPPTSGRPMPGPAAEAVPTLYLSPPPTAPASAGRCRVGMDLVLIDDVAEAIERLGQRYLDRIYTAHELACCASPEPSVQAAGLAARFAAKEAAIKVLQPTGHQPEWKSIEVVRSASGACDLVLHAEAARMAAAAGIGELSLSLSHEGSVAGAVVVALSGPAAAPSPVSPPAPTRLATQGPPVARPEHGRVTGKTNGVDSFSVRAARPRLHLVPGLGGRPSKRS